MLLDARRDRVVVLPASAWSVLCHADGTRDVAGVVAAARRFGATVDVAGAEALLDELEALAWLGDGAPEGLLEGDAQAIAPDDRRWVREMVAGRYRCDGRGDCCRSYPTISLTPVDVHRVSAAMADDPMLAHRSHRVFLPTVGSAPTPMRAIALVDGACRFLEHDGACGVHRHGGAAAKPIGCAWFPTRLVDDGVEIRAAPVVECVCVARPDPSAAPLLPEIQACALPLGITLSRLPERVRFGGGREVDRSIAVATLEGIVARDPARALWTWSVALGQGEAWCGVPEGAAIDASAVARRFGEVAERARIRAELESTWRGPDDMVCRRLRLLAVAAGMLAAPSVAALVVEAEGDAALERHVLDAAIFSRSVLVGEDVARAVGEVALQMWLARATAAFVGEEHDVTLRETPLAAVAATWRAHRLGG